MEQNNTVNKDKNQGHSGSSGGGRRGRSRRGGRSRHGSGQEIRTKSGQFINEAPAAPSPDQGKNQGQNQGKGKGGHSRPSGRHGSHHRREEHGERAATRQTQESGAATVAESRPLSAAAKSVYVTPNLSRTVEDKWMDDTFSSLHEVEVRDPDAEEQARRILDAEGPLLFRETPSEPVADSEAATANEAAGETVEVVGVRFKGAGKKYYFDPGKRKLARGTYVIVETARGGEYGEVCQENTLVPTKEVVSPLRPVLRAATEQDARHHEENRKKEEEAFRTCQAKIAEHGLDMKLVEAQYTFDNSKLLFYFTSDGRVDFRELVKDLAGLFRTRIELRQIGIRDEAKLLGGLGTCGRPLCCYGFLSDFVQVSIKMAKEQNLSLNSSKISGCCGRLMCCLRYEFETYETETRLTPSVGSTVETPDGRGEVVANHPLKGTVTVRLSEKPDEPPRVYHRDGVSVCRKENRREAPRQEPEQAEEQEQK